MPHEPKTHRPFEAYQDFLLGAKLYWTRELYPALQDRYREAVPLIDPPPQTEAEVEALLKGDALAQYFGWFERHLQRMKYAGRYGLTPHFAERREEMAASLAGAEENSRLELAPSFRQPAYYTAVDIHQHPGGVWSDETAGFAYERGARSTTPTLTKDADLHQRFTAHVMAHAGAPKRIVDMGCGFGKSTRPFYAQSEVEVVGVDLAAPCLTLAAETAQEDQARNVRFRQADAAATGLPDAYADVVTSTMMLHEIPPDHIERVLDEAYRVLEPGGVSIHLDFLTDDDPFTRYIHHGHSRRNNEPFMPALNDMDLEAAHQRAGFTSCEIVPFEEAPGALSKDNRAWRFPWVMIIARKPAA